jgi:hypothetical protein
MTSAELWAQITQAPRPHRLVEFPRYNPVTGESIGKLTMWVMTPAEAVLCASRAGKDAKTLFGDKQDPSQSNVYDTLTSSEILYVVCRQAEDINCPFFPSSAAIREHLTTDEMGVLISAYIQLQSELGPIIGGQRMSSAEMDAWLDKLKEGADSISPFYRWSSEQKTEFIQFLVAKLRT